MRAQVIALALMGLAGCGGLRTVPSYPARATRVPEARVLFIADNQEHNMLGGPTKSQSRMSEARISSVAMRSPLANVGGRQLMRAAVEFGIREGASVVIHVGDITDVSCPGEMADAFDALDQSAPGVWFTTLGNHDGFLAGNITVFKAGGVDDRLYKRAPNEGVGHIARTWRNACRLPSMGSDMRKADILTKRDAITAYIARLQTRPGAQLDSTGVETITLRAGRIVCVLKQLTIPAQRYTAAIRLCPAERVPAGDGPIAGPWASYMVQSVDVGSTRILLLDTSKYLDPDVFNLMMKGEVGLDQQKRAQPWLAGRNRARVIMVGHHPLSVIKDKADYEWVLSHASRYVSAHVHAATSLYEHSSDTLRTRELNIASLVDFPSQAVLAEIAENSAVAFRTAGLNPAGSPWPGYAAPCEDARTSWRLENPALYTEYTAGHYVRRLLDAMRAASVVAPPEARIRVPSGSSPSDWLELEESLRAVNRLGGDAAMFWACQSYYASEATRNEKATGERFMELIGRSTKPGARVSGEWFVF